MGLLGAIGFSLALVSLTQIPHSAAQGTSTEKDVYGLLPGTDYKVTLKPFVFYFAMCVSTYEASTVPDTAQIKIGTPLSSTSVRVEWTVVPSASRYYLLLYQATGPVVNVTSTDTSAVVQNLKPSTNYDCYVFTANKAGMGSKSKKRTITTLVQPPTGLTATSTGLGTARVTWQPVKDVLIYHCTVQDIDEPNIRPASYNVSDTKLDVQGILPCSTYLISVSSFNKFLVPSESTEHTFSTNKLRPVSEVSVEYACSPQSATVQWSAVFGADSYKASAIGENGTELTCTSVSTSCQITRLSCGQSYDVHVTPMSENCKNKMNATSTNFQTAPCPPKNLQLERDCSSTGIDFSWDHTNKTEHYRAQSVDSENIQTSADCNSDVLLSKWDLAEGALRYTVEAFGNRENDNYYNCTSQSNSCAIQGVKCGEYLTIFITAFDDECASPKTLAPVAETVPCIPQNVTAVKECGADSISVTWSMSGSALFYVAMAMDNYGVIHSCNAMDLMCNIEGMKCSTNYTVYVISSNFFCNSSVSEMIPIETAACPSDHITASLDCAANEALISWRGRPNIMSYTATILDENQGLLSCSNTNTSCRIPNLKCGQLYTVTVSQHDGMCPSMPSEAIHMESVPCGPNVTADLDCRSQVLTLSWDATSNAEGYTTVVSNNNETETYINTEPGLMLSTLECGLDHKLKVTSFNSTCVSRPTVLSKRETPCVPTDVMVTRTCGKTSAKVKWNESRGALHYEAAAVDEAGQPLLCSSNQTSCTLEGLVCSQVYSVGVTATDDTCTSNKSSAVILRTVPCPPAQLNVSVNCANNSAMLTWSSSPNAVSYTGKAVSADGYVVNCGAGMELGCQMDDLHCGMEYTFTVSASDGECQSPDSKPVNKTTAPCAMESVLNSLDCSTNKLTINWAPAGMALNYSATALAGDGTALHSITEGSNCWMDLQCGQQYNVTVRAISSTCEGQSSVPETVNSVPCVPVNVQGVVECSTKTLQVSWDTAAGADSYSATLNGAGGFSYCATAGDICVFPDLECAQTYTCGVVALNDRCNSSESSIISATTAPCDPTDVAALLHCSSGVVDVTWSDSAGADKYTVLAEANGHTDSCEASSSSCELTQLQCGGDYTVTVLAGDGKCNSSIHAKTNVTTAPCAPEIIDYSLDCYSNNATVTWVKDEDAMSVTVNATSTQGQRTSCSSTNSSCVLEVLQCGQIYTVQAVAQGVQCASEPSPSFQIVTAPCTPTNVEYTYSCVTGIVFLSWDETLGRKSFQAEVSSGDHMVSCSTTQTDCSLTSLLCGRMYDVNVIALADHCNSSVPGGTQIQTAPCAPMNVSSSLVCDNNTAAVSWQLSPGAVHYNVKAIGRDGDAKECNTNSTSCLIPNMHCAQIYLITVTPFSDGCQGMYSYPHTYIAGPCPPTSVQVFLQCVGNMGVVTWTAALQADLYVATAVPSTVGGHNNTCTSNGTNCSLMDLYCGETAVVTVVTIESGCMSEPSLPFTFQSVICPPTGLMGLTTCRNSDIRVGWDPSPESGVEYFLHSQEDDGATANFTTSMTSHVLAGLKCGELYTLKVAATDDECTSVFSEPIQTETAPCPPTNLTARAYCGTSSVTLSWAPSIYAISYTATVTGPQGHVTSCSSNTTTCSVKLDCGLQYIAVVFAFSETCNSSLGESLTFDSAKCLPDSVEADLDCTANSFAVQWRARVSDVGSYTAIAIGSDDTRVTCNSTSTNCSIQNLNCGVTYSIVVTTPSVNCGTIRGSDYIMQSAPCKPDGVLVDLQCSTDMAVVTWENSGPDQSQTVSAVDSRGMTSTCNSSSSNCTFDQLSCGESYVINVVGHTNTCSSDPAVSKRLNTAPCIPTHVSAQVDCGTGITVVMWDSAQGDTSYTVYAWGNLGHNAECNSTDTNCDFPNLACGQDYSISVVARHESCVSLLSESINASSGPCPHSGLQATLDCDTNTAVISWTPGSGILYYKASASVLAFNAVAPLTCSTNGSSCNISSLTCGQSYRLRVSGQGQNCPSPAQDWLQIITAPCPPTNVKVNSSCESNNISVWWQASEGSVSYTAVAEDEQGRSWSCYTSSSSCQISGLPCGQQYHVYVAGVDEECIGAKSDVKVIHTAPCVPQNVQNDLDCLSGVLNVTWQSTGDVSQFRTSVVSSIGHVSTCQTVKHHCVVPNMLCDLTYNLTVVAQDEACNSSHSPTQQVLTAPCPLLNFLPAVNCATGVVSVTWNNSMSGVVYTVTAVDAAGQRQNCSGSIGCDLTTLQCGTDYNVTITPSRDGCVGRDSPTKMIKTVPCVPHLSEVEIDCLANSAWVMFEESAGAEEYVIIATDSQGYEETFECNSTSEGMCSLPSLMCNKNLTFTLEARDQQCPSAQSNAVITETAPCPPSDINTSVDCNTGTISIDWMTIPGAVTYTATLEQINDGTTYCCTTQNHSCNITDPPCGEMFILLIVAEGRTCNSTQSERKIVRTEPCIPQNLKSSLSCSNNVASMSWNYSRGGQVYRVSAVSTDGHVDKCSSFENQCDLTGLSCGEYYTATVLAEDQDCLSKLSNSVTIKTVPCTPANVSLAVDCEANTLTTSWTESSGADSYIATVQDSYGQTTSCQAMNKGSCNVTGLGCGQIFHVSVVSSDGYCNSLSTPMEDTPSVPCKPRLIQAVMSCFMRTATVMWYPADGALSYTVMTSTASGHNVNCETNTTSCVLEGLLCGNSYSVSVTALGWSCSSIAHMPGQLVTEPCIPEQITTEYSLSIGQVLWDMTAGADYYTVEGVTDQGQMVSCVTNDTYCAMYNFDCGQMYNINVTANNQVCQEPCPPQNVQTTVQCQSDVGVVSWESSFGVVGYEVSLAGRDGHSLSCSTNETFCTVEGLHCGVVYYTNVIAIGETINSDESTTVLLVSAPCAAENVEANLDCDNNTAKVSWSSANGADSYTVNAVEDEGHVASCETDELQCVLTGLHCGHTYNISLTSNSDHCQTETTNIVTLITRPCKPLHVAVDQQCGNSTANMFWEEGKGVELYLATATCSMGMTMQCNSTNSTCRFYNLNCGDTCTFSVTAYTHMCYSDISSTVEIQTEPCQPTGLTVSGSCDNDTVVLDWSAAKGTSGYVVTTTGDMGYTSAFQTDETTVEAELPCGQSFTFTVKAQGDRCDSAVSLPQEFQTSPCVPVHVQSFTSCEDSLGSVSWAESDGADSYLAIAVGQEGHTHMCTTNTTSCTWDDLHCGDFYTVHIIANDYMCSSMPSNSTTLRMAPCIPQNLTTFLDCTTKVGSLTWNASDTAEFYTVTAESNSGHKVQLSTTDTWTFISEFECGQEYFLSVQAADSVCTSRPSQPSTLESVSCPPIGVSSFMNCGSNIAVVSWTASAGAKYYTATVTQEDGQSISCWSDGEQCGMPNVQCGQNYTVMVVASNEECNSDPSEADTLQSVPCVPTDVEVTIDCSKNQALVGWSASEGALSYKATAESVQGALSSSCISTNLTCTLTNLICGHTYSVQVVAEEDICSSLPSPDIDFESVPCTPSIGSVALDCFTNSALLSWTYAEGALAYTATAQCPDGQVSTCHSNYTNCELKGLQCGQTYDVTTVASNENCSSPPSAMKQVESVPCPPEDVVPVLNCSTNTAHVSWQASKGADFYIVQAFGMEEHESVCETETQSCVLPEFMCDFTYNISVIAANSICNVSKSDVSHLQAVPCVPQQVEAWLNCESGAVAVSWEPSKGASSYTTIAQGNGGYESTCNSSTTTCVFDDLLCGLNYSITVSASDDTCGSAKSSPLVINTVRCIPQNVKAEMVCSNDTGVVSWEEGEEVSSYMVRAFGPDGDNINCNSTTTSCQLPNMHCGQLYNLTVTAEDGQCDNSNAYLDLQSVPCSPTNVKASLLCDSNSAAVTWERASGALTYRAVGVTEDGSHQTECNNTMTFCDLSDLQCGQTYNVSVYAQDESCSSVESNKAYVRTANCPPQNVVVDSQCDEGTIVVSWSPNTDAQYFHVAAVSNTRARLYCNSSGTACTIKDLPCGQSYNVTVLSVRDGCESKPSAVVETSSAPCVPRNIEGRLDCVSNNAWVTWDASEGALSYSVLATGVGGHNSSCTSTSSPSAVPDLECGTLYTIHVTAVNKHCRSNHSATFELETGPCALSSISAVIECNSSTILVEWEKMDDTPLYLVTAEGHDQTLISCNSSSNSCVLPDIHCGMHYSIIVSASSDKCSSLRSPPKKIKTAPCVPDNVTVEASCEENGATVMWGPSPVAKSFLLTATGRDGHVASCDTSENNCTLTHLHCGQLYNLSITASGDNCTSQPSTSTFRTVPCEPSGLAVDMDCEANSAMLSWDASEGAVEYFACAQSMDGEAFYCENTAASCTIEGLKCGGVYNFSVEASNGVCNSSFSPPLQAGAAPCPPTGVNVRIQKIDQGHWAMTSWDSVNCSDVEYQAKITGRIQNNPQSLMDVSSYWLPRKYFEFPMPCSTAYNLTVRSRNAAAASGQPSAFSGVTVPCAPQNVQFTGDTDSAELSWDASVFATRYNVYNLSGEDRVELCSTTGLSCQLTNFDPDATGVTASNEEGESILNQDITGPAVVRRRRDLQDSARYASLDKDLKIPKVLNVKVSGLSLYVNWTSVKDATEYKVVIEEQQKDQQANQQPRVRIVQGNFYKENDLKPRTNYCIRLAAKNTVNQSEYSKPICRTTGVSS
ncbi:uncharacterized protein LOC117542456 [Gymnodraco acuticeps]|uniref:Uncharacterized protein LOC117542456 n=1 Tax=Gymnodraco acuticeps TaxID=8218 RepID=A0A6P8TPB3_GYMAC|nr:uncharacterized protein LOC117542456 [Gymnodraco acuticeps]